MRRCHRRRHRHSLPPARQSPPPHPAPSNPAPAAVFHADLASAPPTPAVRVAASTRSCRPRGRSCGTARLTRNVHIAAFAERHRAMKPSPPNWLIVHSYRCSSPSASSKNRLSRVCIASAPTRSASAVELAMSQNNTVTCLRSPSSAPRAVCELLLEIGLRVALGGHECSRRHIRPKASAALSAKFLGRGRVRLLMLNRPLRQVHRIPRKT